MTNLPVAQPLRLREKMTSLGAKNLADAELLAIFISSGSGKRSCLQLAYELIHHFGDLRAVLNADLQGFQQIRGLGLVRYLQLQAAREICRRSDFINLQKDIQLNNTRDTLVYLKRQLRDKKNETFAALFLDSQHRVITYEELFHGSINTTSVHPRPLVERALQLNAAAIIVAHNHPSGDLTPSNEDLKVTVRLREAAAILGITLLDHIIFSRQGIYSIQEERRHSLSNR